MLVVPALCLMGVPVVCPWVVLVQYPPNKPSNSPIGGPGPVSGWVLALHPWVVLVPYLVGFWHCTQGWSWSHICWRSQLCTHGWSWPHIYPRSWPCTLWWSLPYNSWDSWLFTHWWFQPNIYWGVPALHPWVVLVPHLPMAPSPSPAVPIPIPTSMSGMFSTSCRAMSLQPPSNASGGISPSEYQSRLAEWA